MFIPSPDFDVAAFGLNIVDDQAPAYAGWMVPPLQGCCGDASSYAILGALGGLRTTAVHNNYVGEFTSVGANVPPYRKQLDCTAAALSAQITARAAVVKGDQLSVLAISGHGTREKYILESVESLVLSDRLMPDYELHGLLAQFPAGSRVAVFVDTCHSGGMDRTAGFQFRPKFAPPLVRLQERATRPAVKPVRADIAFFTACRMEQTARDGQYNGAFTGSLMAVATQAMKEGKRPSWNKVFSLARELCSSQFDQDPVVKYFGNQGVWERPFLK
jgi:hypothetical protein